MFNDSPFDAKAIESALHQTLDDALSEIPEGHSHAILIDGRYAQGKSSASLLYAQRLTKPNGKFEWDIAGGITYGGNDVSGGIATKISW